MEVLYVVTYLDTDEVFVFLLLDVWLDKYITIKNSC